MEGHGQHRRCSELCLRFIEAVAPSASLRSRLRKAPDLLSRARKQAGSAGCVTNRRDRRLRPE